MKSNLFNKKIYRLFVKDQKDREKITSDFFHSLTEAKRSKITNRILRNDRVRIKRLRELLRAKTALSAKDHYMAALIFHHGDKEQDYKTAIRLAKKAAALGDKRAKWLYAAAIDRLCVSQGKKQKYGTQYQFKNGRWSLLPVDLKITDQERKKFNVLPLKKTLAKVEEWNKQFRH